jgi:hypothetical protein
MGIGIEIDDGTLDALAERLAARLRDLPRVGEERFITRRQAVALGVEGRT